MKGFKVEERFDQSTFYLLPNYSKQLILPRRVKVWDSHFYHKEFNKIHGKTTKTLFLIYQFNNKAQRSSCKITERGRLRKESSVMRTRPTSRKSKRNCVSVKALCKVDSTSKGLKCLYRVCSILTFTCYRY